jgi:hydrogenase maturation protease
LGDVLACTQRATEFARTVGFPERGAWEIGIAVSELATNITRHAGSGTLTMRRISTPADGVEILAEDRGPGIGDVTLAMTDDFSEGRLLTHSVPPTLREGLGTGMGAIQRLTDEMSIDSTPGVGTTVRAYKRLPARPRTSASVSASGAPSTPAPAEKPVLILGLGNAILRDDGIGIKVARHIAENHASGSIVVKEAEVAGFALLDLMEDFERAIVVDAVRLPDGEPGEIVVFTVDALTPSLHLVSGHQIDLPTALEMGRQLGRSMPSTVHIVGVQIEDDRTFDESCTHAVEAAIPTAARIALRIAATGR